MENVAYHLAVEKILIEDNFSYQCLLLLPRAIALGNLPPYCKALMGYLPLVIKEVDSLISIEMARWPTIGVDCHKSKALDSNRNLTACSPYKIRYSLLSPQSLLPTRFTPVYRSNYSKLPSSLARMTSSLTLTLTQQPSSNKPTPFLVSLPCFSSPLNSCFCSTPD
ncbi:hypothetical protein Q3G72_015408 [Acer saccharum]|nr:hypothetical protein Q3G72_015408 [Acer saccharum]